MIAGWRSGMVVKAALGVATLPLVFAGLSRAQSPRAAIAPLVLPVNNPADMQGVHTLLKAFAIACLQQGWSEDLPKKLAPLGHSVVNRDVYEYGKEGFGLPRAAIITPTGSADEDKAKGAPFVDMMPSAGSNPGICTVRWVRPWAEPQKANWRKGMMELAAMTPVWSAFTLQGAPISRPPIFDSGREIYSDLTTLLTPCFATSCRVSVNWRYSVDGIELSISRETAGMPTTAGAGRKGRPP